MALNQLADLPLHTIELHVACHPLLLGGGGGERMTIIAG